MTASLLPGSSEAGEGPGASADNKRTTSGQQADNKPGPLTRSLVFGRIDLRLVPPSI
jgi:hypothetical protein